MKTNISLYGNPPFALKIFFVSTQKNYFLDLNAIRPPIENFLKPKKIYEADTQTEKEFFS